MLTHESESVGVIDHETERIFFLQGDDVAEDSHGAGHAEDSLGYDKDAAAILIGDSFRPLEHLLEIHYVVMTELVFFPDMETDSVKEAGVALCIIDNDVMTAGEGIYGGDDSLIAEVEEEGIFLLLEIGEHLFQPLMLAGVPRKHPRAHRISQAPFGCSLCIHPAYFGMVGQAEIVVQAPVEHRNPVESHMRAQFALKTRIHVVAESLLEILSDRAG